MTDLETAVQAVESTVYRVHAADGYALVVRRYAPREPRATVVVGGATGVPQRFYRRFALHAASRGFAVVTVDYRGIGESAPPTLRGFRMDYLDWARLDLAAAVADAVEDNPSGGVLLVGHSYGGLALGLLPDLAPVRAAYLLGSGSGWTGWMPRAERLRVRFRWGVVGPVATRVAGYLPWGRLGSGEDLPLDVYRQWKHWCTYPRFWLDDPEVGAELQAAFDRVTVPVVAASAVDDRWVPPAARDAVVSGFRRAPVTMRDLVPAELGLPAVGHMGYFRRGAELLWDQVLDALIDATDPRVTAAEPPAARAAA